MERPILRVSQVNAYVKRTLQADALLSGLRMTGEISNFKRHSSGHLYFALKDESASVNAVMFQSDASSLHFLPRDGLRVIASGYVSLYEKTGQYQFYARRMEPDGTGALYQAYEVLKEKLRREGLFDPERKKPLPPFPRTVAFVTSPTGAAVQDMMNVAKRRHPGIRLILVPVLVQGDQAAASIEKGLFRADKSGADVIIVGRGGGSIEDLWPFNEERVARAIAALHTPVVSAVGHETDFTIADFAADLRAPTPSAAAELVVPAVLESVRALDQTEERQRAALRRRLELEKRFLKELAERSVFRNPKGVTAPRYLALDQLEERAGNAAGRRILEEKTKLEALETRLHYLDPGEPLRRGYAYVTNEEGSICASVREFEEGDRLSVTFSDGRAHTRVEKKEVFP